MKISVWSDLHLEWNRNIVTWDNPGADVLILGGDICLAEHLYRNPDDVKPGIINKDDHLHDARRYRELFRHVNDNWKHVVYLAGNHEHYEGRWERTIDVLRDEISRYPNIHFLEQDKLVIDDVVFLGASLWSDMNRRDPITMMSIREYMNDYKAIAHYHNSAWDRLRPQTTVDKHSETVQWLRYMLQEDKRKTVIATHHAPSRQSIHASYAEQWLTNGAFVSDLDDLIIDHPHVAMWTHGHVHNPWDYTVGDTRIVCNPYGYGNENPDFNPNLVVDIG